MDVVNGEIVAAEVEGAEFWTGLKRTFDSMMDSSSSFWKVENDQRPSGSRVKLDESEYWIPSWGIAENMGVTNSQPCGEFYSSGSISPLNMSRAVRHDTLPSWSSMMNASGAGRWDNLVNLSSAPPILSAAGDGPSTLQSMKPSSSGALLRPASCKARVFGLDSSAPARARLNPARSLGSPSGVGQDHRHRRRHSGQSPNKMFDLEMAKYEMRIARTASRNVERLSLMSALIPGRAVEEMGGESVGLSSSLHTCGASPGREPAGESFPVMEPIANTKKCDPCVGESKTYVSLLTSKSASALEMDQVCTWIEPLRFLLRKRLTVSDVGELGRVVLPKKDAEYQLPHMDNKEGKLIPMVDHNSLRAWVFRYKWWLNNKSRMYVLENTGTFIKYHDLKEKDTLTLYEDGDGKLVVRGEKILGMDVVLGQSDTTVESTLGRQTSGSVSLHIIPSQALNPVAIVIPVVCGEKPLCRQNVPGQSDLDLEISLGRRASGSVLSHVIPIQPSGAIVEEICGDQNVSSDHLSCQMETGVEMALGRQISEIVSSDGISDPHSGAILAAIPVQSASHDLPVSIVSNAITMTTTAGIHQPHKVDQDFKVAPPIHTAKDITS